MTKPRYTDEFRAGAIAWLEGAGYPDTPGALERVAGQLNVPTRTLRRWWTGESNPVPDNIVTLKKQELADVVKAEVYGILEAMGKTRAEASYKELATAGGIMIDKLQLLQGKPTERTEVIETWLNGLPQSEYDDVIAEAERIIAESRRADPGSGAA